MEELKQIHPPTEVAIRRFLSLLAGRYDVVKAVVYGSHARGDLPPEPDVDVALILDGPLQRFVPTRLALADVAFDVLFDTGINISPLPVWLDEWEHPEQSPNPTLLESIARDGIELSLDQ
ncbi:MAG: nucleotidyltransferase domain-containing protein [Pseudomonadota bacterium]